MRSEDEAVAAGVDYRDRVELTGAEFDASGARLAGQRDGVPFTLHAGFVIDASGRDTRGQGNAKAKILVTMAPEGVGTRVDVTTDLSITGKVAQFGRGVLADVSSKLMGQFVENLERDVLNEAGGSDTSTAGGPYERALESVPSGPQARATEGPRKIESEEVEPVDLLGVAGAPVTKRLVPILVGALALLAVWRFRRRRKARRRSVASGS